MELTPGQGDECTLDGTEMEGWIRGWWVEGNAAVTVVSVPLVKTGTSEHRHGGGQGGSETLPGEEDSMQGLRGKTAERPAGPSDEHREETGGQAEWDCAGEPVF